jgi:hypothetical protein
MFSTSLTLCAAVWLLLVFGMYTTQHYSLKEKTRQMKAMAAELNMCQAQVNEYRYEMERLSRESQVNTKQHSTSYNAYNIVAV